MCDASGAVPVDEHHFLVVSDEDSILRVYDARSGGAPVAQVDLTEALAPSVVTDELPRRKGRLARKTRSEGSRRTPEADIEAASRFGAHGYFLASHARAGGPKHREARYLLFATTLGDRASDIAIVGEPYRRLLEDLNEHPPLAGYDLARAAEVNAPAPDALNIEALTFAPDGRAWIGFRSPAPDGAALLVSIENLPRLPFGERARLGEVRLVDLDGNGLRGLTFTDGAFLIAAGPAGTGRAGRIYRYDGSSRPVPLELSMPDEFNPEGFFDPMDHLPVMLLSDDGNRLIESTECKKHPVAELRGFRGLWFYGT
jgi:hypothetical protein